MTEKFFLLKVQMPDWADKPEQMERVREEIEEHAGACVAFFTRATHVTVKLEAVEPESDAIKEFRKIRESQITLDR